jgi:ATP-binding cassette subfamily B protein
MKPASPSKKGPSLFALLKPYRWFIVALVVLTVLANGLNLVVPKMIASGIDAYTNGGFVMVSILSKFLFVILGIFLFTYAQGVVQVYASELVARDLRLRLIAKISEQDYPFIQRLTPAKLLTNLTSDIDAVKMFVAQAVASIVSSVFLIIGASALLLSINWRLASIVLLVVPIIGGTFFFIFKKVRVLFKVSQEAIDWLNKVINESILGSALIRLLNTQRAEHEKFVAANTEARDVSLRILRLFASLIPVITFSTNAAVLSILLLGGHFVIQGSMTLGDFTAFNNYLVILIFPILVLGFMSNVIAQASASYQRIYEVLSAPAPAELGKAEARAGGDIVFTDVSVTYGQTSVLKDVSFTIPAGTRTAIIGPTAAGKTQLLYLLTGLIRPDRGSITYDGRVLSEYDPVSLHAQIGFVFQDSILFNLTLRENIAFSNTVRDEDLTQAIATAELSDFVDTLPEKLDTIVSERGTSLSGGQKQRVMLARALALRPNVLLLDDFTARMDARTERRILDNVQKNYPDITLVSVTQKIAPVEGYDQILLLMEGELLAKGTHTELMEGCPEYVQIYESQHSTHSYELQAE